MRSIDIAFYLLMTLCIVAIGLSIYYGIQDTNDMKSACRNYDGIPTSETIKITRCLIGNELYNLVNTEDGYKIPELNDAQEKELDYTEGEQDE